MTQAIEQVGNGNCQTDIRTGILAGRLSTEHRLALVEALRQRARDEAELTQQNDPQTVDQAAPSEPALTSAQEQSNADRPQP